jgi:Domain of unknown function (DUF4145)
MRPPIDPKLCPHCGNVTPQASVLERQVPMQSYGKDGAPLPDGVGPAVDYLLLECQTCKDLSLYAKFEYQEWEEGRLEYPSRYDLHPCIPPTVAENYREAKRVQRVSPNAFAVLLRRALEAVCNDRGVSTGPLVRRLKELSNRGEIPGKLSDISTVLRELGNAGAHPTTQRVTVPLTWTMDEFFRTLLEYVYVAPHRLSEFQRSLSQFEEIERCAPGNPTPPSAQAGA